MNCGDWVESCTAVLEHFDGSFELIKWVAPGPSRAVAGVEGRPQTVPVSWERAEIN
jgi:hypothetical protein